MKLYMYIYTYKCMYVFMYHSIHCSNKHAKDENTLSIPVYSFSLKERADKEKQEKHWKQKIDFFPCFSFPFQSQITPK